MGHDSLAPELASIKRFPIRPVEPMGSRSCKEEKKVVSSLEARVVVGSAPRSSGEAEGWKRQ